MSARSFFTPLLERDPSGREWLATLLRATPGARDRLGEELSDAPGSLSMTLSVRGISGVMGAFEYPLAPSRGMVSWTIEHPQALRWVDETGASPQTVSLRRALVLDDPPGSRGRAQERARELMGSRSVLSREWWRFEELGTIECLLMTDRLVLIVITDTEDPRRPVSPWYPPRTALVRDIEAARELAAGRAWACLLVSENPLEIGEGILDDSALAGASPHLGPAERTELRHAYVGNLTWDAAAAALAG